MHLRRCSCQWLGCDTVLSVLSCILLFGSSAFFIFISTGGQYPGLVVGEDKYSLVRKSGFCELTGSTVIYEGGSPYKRYCVVGEGIFGYIEVSLDKEMPPVRIRDVEMCSFREYSAANKTGPSLLAQNKGTFRCWKAIHKTPYGIFSFHFDSDMKIISKNMPANRPWTAFSFLLDLATCLCIFSVVTGVLCLWFFIRLANRFQSDWEEVIRRQWLLNYLEQTGAAWRCSRLLRRHSKSESEALRSTQIDTWIQSTGQTDGSEISESDVV